MEKVPQIPYEKDLKGRLETFGLERKKRLKNKKFFTYSLKKTKKWDLVKIILWITFQEKKKF